VIKTNKQKNNSIKSNKSLQIPSNEEKKTTKNDKPAESNSTQRFNDQWLDEKSQLFKPWIEKISDKPFHCKCKWCEKIFKISNMYGKKGHCSSEKHQKNKNDKTKDKAKENGKVEDNNETCPYTFNECLKIFEYKLSRFIVDNNLSLSSIQAFCNFLNQNLTSNDDFDILKALKLSRKKLTQTLNSIIQPLLKEELEKKLEIYPYSIVLDESLDISKRQQCVIMTQFYDRKLKKTECRIHSVIDTSLHMDAQGIYDVLSKNLLDKAYGKNFIGYISDGAYTLRGSKNSVLTRLQQGYPNLWTICDISHILHRSSNYACKAIPNKIEQVVKDTYNFFAHSAKKTQKWLEFQKFMNLKPYTLLRYVNTRWLSLEASISRIINRKSELIEFFKEGAEDDTDGWSKY
jgi:hypothetical protein